jgi:hypothetical protein
MLNLTPDRLFPVIMSNASKPFQTIAAAVSSELRTGDPQKAYALVDQLIQMKPMGPDDRRCMLSLRIALRAILSLRSEGLPPEVDLQHFIGVKPDFELAVDHIPALEAVLAEDVKQRISDRMPCPNCGSPGTELGWAHPVRSIGVPHGRFYVDPDAVFARAVPGVSLTSEHANNLVTMALANLAVRIPVLACGGCALRYLSWTPDKAVEANYQAPPGGGFDLRGQVAFGRGHVFRHVYEKAALPLYLEQVLGGVDGLSMYEFGCAEGVMAALLRDLGASVRASDLDRPKIQYGREIMGLDSLSDDPNDYTLLPERSLDCLYAFHTIEHLLQPDAFLDMFSRSLRAGGHLVISVPRLARMETGEFPEMGGDHLIGFDADVLAGC